MHRFFTTKEQLPNLIGSDVHHLRDVLRMKVGDSLELLDGSGKIYTAKISEIEKNKITCEIISSKQEESEPKVKVTIAQSLPKASKMDLIIEKCTELGVHQIIPMQTERTIAKSPKLDRWKKIAKEAVEQSGRAIIPAISPLTDFQEVLKMRNQFELALIPWELEKNNSLKQALTTYRPNHLLILIGPEGGFSQKEIELAKEAGFTPISLGKRILRTETAGIAVLSAIMYEYD